MTLGELITKIESAARFRAQKAVEYPEDQRNTRSSYALTVLAGQLARLQESLGNLRYVDDTLESTPEHRDITQYIARYGFSDEQSNPLDFLSDLTQHAIVLLEAHDPERAVFETARTHETNLVDEVERGEFDRDVFDHFDEDD